MLRFLKNKNNSKKGNSKETENTQSNSPTNLDNFRQELSDFNSLPAPGGEHDHQVPSEHDYQKIVESMCAFLKEHLNEKDKNYLKKNKKCTEVRFSDELKKLIILVNDSTLKKLNRLNDVREISSLHFAIFKRSQEMLLDKKDNRLVDEEEIKNLQRRYEEFEKTYNSSEYRFIVTDITNMTRLFSRIPTSIEQFKKNTHADETVKLLNPDQEIVLNELIKFYSAIYKLLIPAQDTLDKIQDIERKKLLKSILDMLTSTLVSPSVEKSNNQTVNTSTTSTISARAQHSFHAPEKSSSLPTSKATDLPRKPYPKGS